MTAAVPFCVAIIPARGGSKRIPRKNLVPIGGLPLVAHSIRHARAARSVAEVWVSTDDAEIAAVARGEEAEVVMRPAEIAHDAATSESAIAHALDARAARALREPDLVVFLQCTSPVRRVDDIDRAVATLIAEGADSLFSACENNRLIWARGNRGLASLTYDYRRRRREQDMEPQFRENGSIYVFKPSVLRDHDNRLGGRIACYEMDYWSSFQIDTPEHVELCEWILGRPEFSAVRAKWPERIDLVVFDFDGVMTDNTVLVAEDGREAVVCSRGDGLGLERLQRAGVPLLVLSKEANPVVAARCRKLGLPCVQGIADKRPFLEQRLTELGVSARHVIYVGNDVNDVECMRLVGLPVAVGDAHPAARAAAALVLRAPGGRGAVREICDLILQRVGDRVPARGLR